MYQPFLPRYMRMCTISSIEITVGLPSMHKKMASCFTQCLSASERFCCGWPWSGSGSDRIGGEQDPRNSFSHYFSPKMERTTSKWWTSMFIGPHEQLKCQEIQPEQDLRYHLQIERSNPDPTCPGPAPVLQVSNRGRCCRRFFRQSATVSRDRVVVVSWS